MPRCATNLPWGFEEVRQNKNQVLSPDPQQLQYANLPAALLSTLKREKKPFTYTPGGVNLSQVLEARLQKRNERKKKYQEEVEQQNHGHQLLVVSPTYNSPLNMYSMENALETLEVQAKMAASRSPSSTLPRNYKFKFQDEDDEEMEPSQSKAFRVLQVMTDTEMYSGNRKQKDGPTISQMRFTGLREGRPTNPSKFFHTLQKITGTDAEEEEEERRENTKPEKRITPAPTIRKVVPPTPAVPVQQPQPSFGSAPRLMRPAAFLPKQQTWSYQHTKTPAVGTDF